MMPGMDGYEVCRRIREHPATAYLPVVMITASDTQEKVRGIEAGADDFVTKPFDQAELLARVKSLVRVKRYQDTIRRQAAELEAWNRQLEERVQSQVAALERATRLRRFLSPQMAELILDSGDESFLESHRREIVVVFCDLRQFTAFAESSEPEELMAVLSEYHGALGDLVFRFEGTLERFTGDGLMVVFNDPMPCEDAGLRAIRMAVAMRTRVRELAESWSRHGHDLAFGVGVAQGYATLGRIGFEGRFEYTAHRHASSTSPPACAQWRSRGRSSSRQRVLTGVEDLVVHRPAGDLELNGFSRPVRAFDVKGLDTARVRRERHRRRDRHGGRGQPVRTRRGAALPALRPPPAQHATCVGRHAPEPGERVRGGHPLGDARSPRRGQRQHDAGVRGALPLPLAAAARATPAHGVRDVDTDRPRHRRVLPGPAPRRDPQPRPRPPDVRLRRRRHASTAQSEAARTAPAPPPHRGAHPGPIAVPSHPVQHDGARA